jgi:hypothetical protein
MKNQKIFSEQSSHDQHPDEDSHSIKNINNLQDISNDTNDLTTNPQINSRRQRHSDRSLFFRIYSRSYSTTTWAILGFILFTIIATTISVLIIYFTTKKSSNLSI